MLIFISGSINAGKTTTSKALAKRLNAALVHVDELNDTIPNFSLETDLDKSMDLAIQRINELSAQGKDVVADDVVREDDWKRFEIEINTKPQIVVTLAPPIKVTQSNRGERKLTEWEVSRIKYHYDTGIASPSFGHTIDNSKLTVEETVDRIVEIVAKYVN